MRKKLIESLDKWASKLNNKEVRHYFPGDGEVWGEGLLFPESDEGYGEGDELAYGDVTTEDFQKGRGEFSSMGDETDWKWPSQKQAMDYAKRLKKNLEGVRFHRAVLQTDTYFIKRYHYAPPTKVVEQMCSGEFFGDTRLKY